MFADWESTDESTPALTTHQRRDQAGCRAADPDPFAFTEPVVIEIADHAEGRSPTNAAPPLAYGYLRTDLVGDGDRAERQMIRAAWDLGFQLAAVFREQSPQTAAVPPAYVDLVCECCRAEAHMVITVPGHLCGMAVPRMVLLDMLAVRAHAQVCEVTLR
ncbi:hypothetical protein [Nocardia wallacei]|uniref:hypothetical protein n=1 Tax=Nocardia wallacei TaxID=480035 RepID=UPI0024568A18|nr:hypothetical protein [Nocardia wallacei]